MTKEQEAGVREALTGMDAAVVEEAIAQARELGDAEEIAITITTVVATHAAAVSAHAADLERQNAVNERSQRARDAAYEIAMNTPDSGIVH